MTFIIKIIATIILILIISALKVSSGTSGAVYTIIMFAVLTGIWSYNPNKEDISENSNENSDEDIPRLNKD